MLTRREYWAITWARAEPLKQKGIELISGSILRRSPKGSNIDIATRTFATIFWFRVRVGCPKLAKVREANVLNSPVRMGFNVLCV